MRIRALGLRWIRFLAVGVIGLAVQIFVLQVGLSLGVVPVAASLLGVEAALLNNFLWHRSWTWKDRPVRRGLDEAGRLLRFHLCSGTTSLAGHGIVVPASLAWFDVSPLVANLYALTLCGGVNFLLADLYAFSERAKGLSGR